MYYVNNIYYDFILLTLTFIKYNILTIESYKVHIYNYNSVMFLCEKVCGYIKQIMSVNSGIHQNKILL